MKQLAFMMATAFLGSVGAFVLTPVYGFAVYYMYAILRPDVLWQWSLPTGYRWSLVVGIGTLFATMAMRFGLWVPPMAGAPPWYGDPKYTRTHYLFLAFVAWICVTYPTAFRPDIAFEPFVEYVKIFVMFVAATFALRKLKDLWVIYYTITLTTLYIVYEVNFKYLVDHRNILDSWSIAGLDNNGSSLLFAMVIPLSYFAFEAGRHWLRWGFLFMIPLVLHAIMLSFSRGAMLTAIFGAGLIYLRSRNKKFLSVLYGLAFVMVVITAGPEVQKRFMSISKTETDDSAKSRLTTWKIAFRMMSERPIFGLGIRNSPLKTREYGADMEGRAIHSQYLQTGADSGVTALVLYLALLVAVLRSLWYSRRTLRLWNDPETQRAQSMISGLECSLLCFCLGAFFLSLEHFEMPYIVMLLSLQMYAITKAIVANTDPATLAVLEAARQQEMPEPRMMPPAQPVPS